MNHKKTTLPWIAIISLIGAAISIWQTKLFYATRTGMSGMRSFCNIGQTFDCTAVEMSKYSEFFAGLPLSGLAIAGYLVILLLALYGFSDSAKQNIKKYLILFSAIAVLFSVTYLAIMLVVIGKFCVICLSVDLINILLLVFALRLPQENETTSAGGVSVTQLAGIGAIALVVAFLCTRALNPLAEMKQEDITDIIENVMNAPVTPIEIPADAPFVGPANAPITIVKFSDYECPACKMGANAIHPLFKRYPNDVKFVFINYPLDQACNPEIKRPMHTFACEAATVAICASEQGKFMDAYETLFENQESFKTGQVADVLASVPGLDLQKMKSCTALPSTSEKIKRDIQLGVQVKIQSTPTFFINGKKVEGGLPTNIWVQIIDRMLKK